MKTYLYINNHYHTMYTIAIILLFEIITFHASQHGQMKRGTSLPQGQYIWSPQTSQILLDILPLRNKILV